MQRKHHQPRLSKGFRAVWACGCGCGCGLSGGGERLWVEMASGQCSGRDSWSLEILQNETHAKRPTEGIFF